MLIYSPKLKVKLGIPGWLSGLAPAFGPGRDPGVLSQDSRITPRAEGRHSTTEPPRHPHVGIFLNIIRNCQKKPSPKIVT